MSTCNLQQQGVDTTTTRRGAGLCIRLAEPGTQGGSAWHSGRAAGLGRVNPHLSLKGSSESGRHTSAPASVCACAGPTAETAGAAAAAAVGSVEAVGRGPVLQELQRRRAAPQAAVVATRGLRPQQHPPHSSSSSSGCLMSLLWVVSTEARCRASWSLGASSSCRALATSAKRCVDGSRCSGIRAPSEGPALLRHTDASMCLIPSLTSCETVSLFRAAFGVLNGGSCVAHVFVLQAEGLCHVSNISSARLSSAKEAVERGQDVWVKVVTVT